MAQAYYHASTTVSDTTTVYGSSWQSYTDTASSPTPSWSALVSDAATALEVVREFAYALQNAGSRVAEIWTEYGDQLEQLVHVTADVGGTAQTWTGSFDPHQGMVHFRPVEMTGEERRARERIIVEQQRRILLEHAEYEKALQKANDLLMTFLNDEQRKTYQREQFFDLTSQSGKRFRITYGYSLNVYKLNKWGEYEICYCVVPDGENIPIPDQMLAQKLMLEHQEKEFIRVSNHHRV